MKCLLQLSVVILTVLFIASCESASRYAIDEQPLIKADNRLVGVWTILNDTNTCNYLVISKTDDYHYSINYIDSGGTYLMHEGHPAFISDIANFKFINIGYWASPFLVTGYFIVRIIDIDKDGLNITLSLILDKTLKDLPSSLKLRQRIVRNLDNPAFHDEPIVLHRVLPMELVCKP